MPIFPRFLESRSRQRSTSGLDAYNDFWYQVVGADTQAGVQVSEKTALKYLTVFACVTLIAGDLARLPLILYRRNPNNRGKERVMDHPLYDILHNTPNPEMTSFQWRETGQGHCLLWGNQYSVIQRNARDGEIVSLWPIADPGSVQVKRNEGGRIFYRWRNTNGEEQIKFKNEIFHVPGFGFNGLVGLSMISLAREAIGLGLATQQFGSRYFSEGTHPSGLITFPDGVSLGDQEEDYKKYVAKNFSGLGKSHSLMFGFHGETFKPLTVPMDDAQFLESREFQKTEICGFYRVPPHKVAIHNQNTSYNSLEQENASYVDSCLILWLARWEQCINQQLLTARERKDGLFAEFLVDALLRGDSAARGEFYNKQFQLGSITPNEIRAMENRNPIDGGDQAFVQLNLIPLGQTGDLMQPKQEKKALAGPQETRSIVARDRISKQYHPLFVRAAEKIVNREAIAIKKKINQQRKQRSKEDIEKWLRDFYNDLPAHIKREMGPVFKSFSDAIITESIREVGNEPDKAEIEKFVSDYIDTYTLRHTSSSLGQMLALLEGEIDDLEQRADEWSETRPEKIANNETTRGANAFFQAVAFAAGISTVWRIRGAETCPYCKELNGKRVSLGDFFINDGDELDPEGGTGPMKIRGTKAHPPLHQGCDCYLTAG